MASNYACRACSRALLRPSSLAVQGNLGSRSTYLCIASQNRSFATGASSPDAKKASPPKPKTKTPKKDVMPEWKGGLVESLAAKIHEKTPAFTEPYIAYGLTQKLLDACAEPGDYTIPQALEKNGEIPTDENGVHLGVGKGSWYETLGITPTFGNWAQATFIHMYMLQVRFRMFPPAHASVWVQHLTNHAFYAAEDRLVVWHKMTSNSIRQKYLKETFAQWRAVILSYDEGLVKGDAMLAAAVWRNLFGGREDVDFQKLAQVVAYMRKEIKRLETASAEQVVTGWTFSSDLASEAEVVKRPSRMMLEGKKS